MRGMERSLSPEPLLPGFSCWTWGAEPVERAWACHCLGGLSPTPAAVKDDTGLFQFPELWKFLPCLSGTSSILLPGPWDLLTPYEARFCSAAVLYLG